MLPSKTGASVDVWHKISHITQLSKTKKLLARLCNEGDHRERRPYHKIVFIKKPLHSSAKENAKLSEEKVEILFAK